MIVEAMKRQASLFSFMRRQSAADDSNDDQSLQHSQESSAQPSTSSVSDRDTVDRSSSESNVPPMKKAATHDTFLQSWLKVFFAVAELPRLLRLYRLRSRLRKNGLVQKL